MSSQILRKMLLQGVYDQRINQGMWLSLATGFLVFPFYVFGQSQLAIYAVLAIFPSLFAGVDQPGPRFSSRLIRIDLLFFATSLLVLWLQKMLVPLVLFIFPLVFVFAMFASYGNRSGRVGTSAMIVATLSLSCSPDAPIILFPLLIGFGTFWYGVCARLWMVFWGHRVLRDILARLFLAIAKYSTVKTELVRNLPSEEQYTAVYEQQELVYDLIGQSKVYLNYYGEEGYDHELKGLKQDFLFAIDVMELLQANQHRLDELRDFIRRNNLSLLYSDMSAAVVASLAKKAFAIRTRQLVSLDIGSVARVFEDAVKGVGSKNSVIGLSLLMHLNLLKTLINSQGPVFERILAEARPQEGIIATLRPHITFKSPVFRYALRLSVTMACGVLSSTALGLDKNYWVLLAILFVMQSGYLLTKTLITQRVLGTLAGVGAGLLIIQLAAEGKSLIFAAVLVSLFSLSMIFHHRILAITGVTALVVLGYQLAFSSGQEVVMTRLVDSLLGCGLAFTANILLWPQWHGEGIKRLLKETLLAQEDLLIFCVRAFSDRSIKFEQLTRRRLKLYTAQNNLLASYQQMLREPQHTRDYVDTLELVVGHFVATAAHINALLTLSRTIEPMSKELTAHLEQLLTVMFSRCDESKGEDTGPLEGELRIVYQDFKAITETEASSEHFPIIHLLELIYERLDAAFKILDFCTAKRNYFT